MPFPGWFHEKDITVQFRGDHLLFSASAPRVEESDESVQYFKRRLKLKDIEEQRYYVPADKFDQAGAQARFHNGLLADSRCASAGAYGHRGRDQDRHQDGTHER